MGASMNRRINKDKEGTEKLNKAPRIVLEDHDACVNALAAEFEQNHQTMQMILSYFEDPADAFKLQMPGHFAVAKEKVGTLLKLREDSKMKYEKLLGYFKMGKTKSSDFFMMWDNFLVPSELILNRPEKMKKEMLTPAFCQNKPVMPDDFMILWKFKEWDDKQMKTAKQQPGGASAVRKKRERGRRPNQAKAHPPTDGAPEGGKAKANKGGKPGKGAPPAPADEGAASSLEATPAPKAKGKGKGDTASAARGVTFAEDGS